ncbi:MAG: methionine biosynthesis protein MetW [Beijerinckiaceae bacterium]
MNAPLTGPDAQSARLDHILIADMVEKNARVLDVGCGEGELLSLLGATKNVDGRGIELSREGVSRTVSRGLAVIQGDADTDLADYPDDSFDYVILSQTIQATRNPRQVLEQMLRVGHRAIVSFPNFGHWRIRSQLVFRGRMPVTENLPDTWYNTPNIHFCTIRDFVALCREVGAVTERAVALNAAGRPIEVNAPWWFWNLFGDQAVFLLRRG